VSYKYSTIGSPFSPREAWEGKQIGCDLSLSFGSLKFLGSFCIFDHLAACSRWDGKEAAIFGPCTVCAVGDSETQKREGSVRRLRRKEGLKMRVGWWESAFMSDSGWVRKRQVTGCWG